jgi:hypothetical protein
MMMLEDGNMTRCYTNQSCLNLTTGEYNAMFYSMVAFFAVSAIFSFIAIIMAVVIGGFQLLKLVPEPKIQTLQLALFVLISVLLTNLGELLRTLPSNVDECGHVYVIDHQFCKASGFLLEYFSLITYFLCFFVTFYLLKYVTTCCTAIDKYPFPWIILMISILISLGISWIPFVGGHYELAGAWCWINTKERTCEMDPFGFVEEILLYYFIVFILTISMFIMAVIILISLCTNCFYQQDLTERQKANRRTAIIELIPLLIYPIMFTIIFGIELTHRIIYFATPLDQPIFPLWIIHAVVDSADCTLVPLAFIIYFLWGCLKTLKRKKVVKTLMTLTTVIEDESLPSSSRHETMFLISGSMSGDETSVLTDAASSIMTYSELRKKRNQI